MTRLFSSKKLTLILFLSSIFFSSFAFSQETYHERAENQEESLFLRRIAEFWEDGEYSFAKVQIETYLKDFPETHLSEYLHALLGNIAFEEKDLSTALSYYDQIKTLETKDKIYLNLLQGLYDLGWHARLQQECIEYLDKNDLSADLQVKVTFLLAESLYNQAISNEEKKKDFAELAKKQYSLLLGSEFEKEARYSLSQLDYILEDYEGAIANYLELAEKEPRKREEFLFQAATLQTETDKEKALDTFSEIIKTRRSKYREAAFNKLVLLFELEKFDELFKEKNSLLELISKDKIYLSHFFIGKAYFQQKDYKHAVKELNEALRMDDKSSLHMKLNLLMLMQSAFQLNDRDLYGSSFEKFFNYFPKDTEMTKALFGKAILNKNNNKLNEAKLDFEKVEKALENLDTQDQFLFEYAHLLYKTGQINQARAKFQQFLEQYKDHPLKSNCWHYLINSSLKAIANSENKEEEDFNRKALLEDIDAAIQIENLFSNKEKMEYKLLKAKTNFQIKNYESSLNEIKELISQVNEETISINNDAYFDYKDFAEMHLIAAYCHKNLNNNNLFCEHIEKAISLNNALDLDQSIYIHLFNAKVKLAKESENADELINIASNYLFKAFTISNINISNENLNWLSSYYYSNVKIFLENHWQKSINDAPETSLYSKRALRILETLNHNLSDDFVVKEPIIIKLAYLNKSHGELEKNIELLENLVSQYRLSPTAAFSKKSETIHELTKTYTELEKNDKALIIYNEFLDVLNENNYFSLKAKLEFARLKLITIANEKKTLDNPEIEQIISYLKTISMQKNLQNEPVHLEAALDYVDLLCYMENSEAKAQKRVLLLKRLKENFFSENDLLSQDYQSMRKALPAKEKLFQAYMILVDAEMLLAEQKYKLANSTLLKLIDDDLIATEYINTRMKKNFKMIEERQVEL